MKRYLLVLLIGFLALFSGCQSNIEKNASDVNESKQQLSQAELQLEETSRQLTAAIKDISEPTEQPTKESLLAEKKIINLLASEDLRIEGLPIERLNTKELILLFHEDKQKLLDKIKSFENTNTDLLKEKNLLEERIKNLRNALIIEQEKSWFSTFIQWFLGLGISGMVIIVLLGLFGIPFAAPILNFIVNGLTSRIPQLITFFGTVSKDVFDGVVEGVEKLKNRIDEEPEDKTFTKQEVKKIISSSISKNNPRYNNVISARKNKIKEKI